MMTALDRLLENDFQAWKGCWNVYTKSEGK